ncbi:MAG: DUF362 domain-containing protein [Deltaproteobacteria bacterium]|nr:DUF362 domain-containing protein [Deltaproteobacteria bacterium]
MAPVSRISLSRRSLIGGAAAVASGAAALAPATSDAEGRRWAARPPAGFTRLSLPGKVVRVTRPGSLQDNGAYPKPEAAQAMLEAAMTALTGKASLREAFATVVHPDDVVAIKPNGIAGRKTMKMATNVELVAAIARAVIDVGVPPEKITVFEQYRDFLYATRCVTNKDTLAPAPEMPAGIRYAVHLNKEAEMDKITVGGVATRYVTPFTSATVVLNVSQMKDHSICGFTGAMKNITHGSNVNPHEFHAHNASPQIAHLYAQEVVRSRVALHITDAFQVIYDEGPIDVNPRRRAPHESIYAATDPVALDVVGWEVIEGFRKENGLPTLAEDGRSPSYLDVAAALGLGVADRAAIALREIQA